MSGLDPRLSLIPSYSTSTSFSYTASPTLLSPEQLDPLPPPVIFHGASITQNAFDYTVQYQHPHQNFPTPSQHYPQRPYQDLSEDNSNDDNHKSKRLRVETETLRVDTDTMPCFPFKFGGPSNEKSSEHDYPGDADERCTINVASWNPFSDLFATRSDHGPSPCEQLIPFHWTSLRNELTLS